VIWLSFQECTGCTESLTRSHSPTVEKLIFDVISLDHHHTLMAASGYGVDEALHDAMKENYGKYLLLVDGSIPVGNPAYSTISGVSNLDQLTEAAKGAAAIVSIGTCAAFGGIPHANPNPTGAVAVSDIIKDKPIINVSGCPPFFGQNIHDRCYRRPFYERGQFAETFDDEGAKKGWCLFKLGCKGPVTYNACATTKWNEGTSWPVESGHGCLGCSQPDFWDMGGFYNSLSTPTIDIAKTAAVGLAAGAAVGVAAGALNRMKKNKAAREHETVTINDLEKGEKS
jgi:hydrogenase small subunit